MENKRREIMNEELIQKIQSQLATEIVTYINVTSQKTADQTEKKTSAFNLAQKLAPLLVNALQSIDLPQEINSTNNLTLLLTNLQNFLEKTLLNIDEPSNCILFQITLRSIFLVFWQHIENTIRQQFFNSKVEKMFAYDNGFDDNYRKTTLNFLAKNYYDDKKTPLGKIIAGLYKLKNEEPHDDSKDKKFFERLKEKMKYKSLLKAQQVAKHAYDQLEKFICYDDSNLKPIKLQSFIRQVYAMFQFHLWRIYNPLKIIVNKNRAFLKSLHDRDFSQRGSITTLLKGVFSINKEAATSLCQKDRMFQFDVYKDICLSWNSAILRSQLNSSNGVIRDQLPFGSDNYADLSERSDSDSHVDVSERFDGSTSPAFLSDNQEIFNKPLSQIRQT